MSSEFSVEILTPARELITTTASEVLLPTKRGEIGILPLHEDICGLLSTGTLKLIHEGKDYWFMVSGGAFRIQEGSLSVLAQYAQGAETVATEETIARLKLVEAELSKVTDTQAQDYITLSSEKNRLDSSLEASRRHTMS